ncbi:brachyurin-like [Bacillus rossius redtenbacheri]|uniref:brachyurin-like n=1 Tax=Bacillus rossius redtenbacheri TaxID=93214 RepID=UPI002FDEF389
MEVFVLSLLVAAAQAAPSLNSNGVGLEPIMKRMPVLDDAPVYPTSRIVNGRPASRGQLPYQAALFLDGRNFCGGSLISPSWILTAAHCTVDVELVTAYLGVVRLHEDQDSRAVLETRQVVNHAAYNPTNLNNDVALVHLPRHAPLSHEISVVNLPSYSQAVETFVNQPVRASGWGRTSDTAAGVSPHLNYIDVSVISNAACARTYGTSVVVPATLCASAAGGQSTCSGDSGGPLVTLAASPTLVGVVSFVSQAGCASGNPSGYMRVTAFLDWIHAVSGLHIRA